MASRLSGQTWSSVSAARVPVLAGRGPGPVAEVDQVDGGDPAPPGRGRDRRRRRSSSPEKTVGAAAGEARVERRVGGSPRAGSCRSQSPTMSNRTIALICASGGAALGAAARIVDVLAAAARCRRPRSSRSPRASSPSKRAIAIDGPGHRIGQRPGELEHDGDSGGAVVGADEARDPGLGVVVGAEQDVAAAATGDRRRPRSAADAGSGRPRPRPRGARRRDLRVELRSAARTGRARAERDLVAQVGERARAVEGIAADRRDGSFVGRSPQPLARQRAGVAASNERRQHGAGRRAAADRRGGEPRDMRDTLGPCPRVTWIG